MNFPPLPGCISDGETVSEAIASGMEAKANWIATMTDAGCPIPSSAPSGAYP